MTDGAGLSYAQLAAVCPRPENLRAALRDEIERGRVTCVDGSYAVVVSVFDPATFAALASLAAPAREPGSGPATRESGSCGVLAGFALDVREGAPAA